MSQLNLFEGKSLRDAAVAKVSYNSGDFMSAALAVISTFPVNTVLTGEDIRVRCEERGVIPHHVNAWGALTRIAYIKGLIIPTGAITSAKKVSSHACMLRVYKVAQR